MAHAQTYRHSWLFMNMHHEVILHKSVPQGPLTQYSLQFWLVVSGHSTLSLPQKQRSLTVSSCT